MSRFILPFADVGNGISPASGAKLFFYETGTGTNKDTFSDEALTIANANPVIANADGVFPDIWLGGGGYKVRLEDKNSTQEWEADAVRDYMTSSSLFVESYQDLRDLSINAGDTIYVKGQSTAGDGGESFFQKKTGAAPATYVDDGERVIIPTGGDGSAGWVRDMNEKTYLTLTLAAASTSIIAGDVLTTKERTAGNGGGAVWDVVLTTSVTPNTFNIVIGTGNALLSLVLRNTSPVNVKQWGATGDGTTDDRLAIFAAMDYVSSLSGTLFFPIGDYRMTAGYTNSVAYNDIKLLGEGVNRENIKTPQVGSVITLDSTNPATFFYKQASRHFLQAEGLIFRCAQYAGNRKFFIWDFGGAVHNFQNCNFEDVEKPINYTANCYFQNAAFRDVQFRGSGTFHSESNDINGTLLLLDNVNHEGVVPLNTDKVVCDLRGIREIQGSNFLLEGSLAETGWTIIRTDATASTDWIQSPTMLIDGFHSEWSINLPTYTLDLVSGYYKFSNSNAFLSDGVKCRLDTKARLVLEGVTITSGTPINLDGYFELVDLSSTITLNNCGARLVDQPLNPRITLNDFSRLDTDIDVSNTLISGNAPLLLASFDGGYFDDDLTTITLQNGTTWTPSTDATHGRKAIITAGTSQRFWLSVINGVNWTAGEQFIIKARIQLPTFTGGLYKVAAHVNFADVAAVNYDSTSSASIVEVLIPFRLLTAQTTLGVNLADNNPTGVSGAFEVLTLEIYRGSNITNTFQTLYPKFVTSYGAAAPTVGAWKQGDKVYDSTPSAGGTMGWVCTAGGAPGTWKTFGAITV